MGSIPAGAGEPWELFQIKTKIGVYPRGCGGAPFVNFDDAYAWGLSPRVRGSL